MTPGTPLYSDDHGKATPTTNVVGELLDVIEELHGFLRYGTFDAEVGESAAYRRGREVLARYGRLPITSSMS
jgi:hypothetical protein